MRGITVAGGKGLGDKLSFSCFPENYFRNTGEKLVDVDRCWIFDHNPYIVRDVAPTDVIDLWAAPWPINAEDYGRKPVFSSIAERTSSIFDHVTYLRHPR